MVRGRWLPWIGALLSFLLYLKTMAPTVGFVDCGELAASAVRLWIPHPTGYPLFLLLGRLVGGLPLGSEEIIRLNTMSAALSALGIALFAHFLKLVLDLVDTRQAEGEGVRWVIASSAALTLALSRSYWITSTAVEAYPLYLFLLTCDLYLFGRFMRETDPREERRAGRQWAFVMGLSLAGHLSIVLAGPAFLAALLWRYTFFGARGAPPRGGPSRRGRERKDIGPLLASLVVPFLLGLSPILLLPLRAAIEPPMNWIYPLDLSHFWAHISGARYRDWMLDFADALPRNSLLFWRGLPGQFGYAALALAVAGIAFAAMRARPVLIFTLIMFLTCFAYAATYDISEIEPFFLQCYVTCAAWIGLGVFALLRWRTARGGRSMFLVLVAACLAIEARVNYPQADRSRTFMPEDFMVDLLSDAAPGAVICTGDYSRIFSVFMYLHHVRGLRPDVTLVEVTLLTESWYLRTLEKHQPLVYDGDMRSLWEGARAGHGPTTIEDYRRGQLGLILERVYEERPVYFGSSVEHSLVPPGYRVIPAGLLYRLVREGDPAPAPIGPKDYRFRDIGYVDYNADKIRDIYMTMLYANGIWAEDLRMPDLALAYYDRAASFFPASANLVSHHREGDYLRERRRDVEQARERVRRLMGS